MKKKVLGYVMAGALAVGVVGVVPAFAETGSNSTAQTEQNQFLVEKGSKYNFKHGHKNKFLKNEEAITKKAEELGISTEGKDIHELGHEVRNAEIKKQAKELGIKTEDKKMRDIVEEIKKTLLTNEAKELGISVEGKELKELAQEIKETKLKKAAAEFGIKTEGKELRELAQEIREAQILKLANELQIESEGKELRELAKEVHEKQILQVAKRLGIDTNNKTTKEIMEELKTNYADELENLELLKFRKHHNSSIGEKRGRHLKGFHHNHKDHSSVDTQAKKTANTL